MARPGFTFWASALLLLMVATPAVMGKTWALLTCSANSWFNYGVQSSVMHAYQVLIDGGIPEEQIVLMIFDDLAQNEKNPFKGNVFHSYDLIDVYEGAKKDYTGKEVTKDVFLAVMRGDKDAVKRLIGREGKVIDSGPEDNVFVFLADHGGPGIVHWWDFNDLTAKEFNNTVAYMHTNKRYNNMTIYIDACYSGSMFKHILPSNIGVYAVTAANSTQSAWLADCGSEAFPASVRRYTCLGDIFGLSWIYQTQSVDRTNVTLEKQFREIVDASQGWCNPKQFGDLSIARVHLSAFLGNGAYNRVPRSRPRRVRRSADMTSPVPQHMMQFYQLKRELATLSRDSERYGQVNMELRHLKSLMHQADDLITDVMTRVYGKRQSRDMVERAKREFGEIQWGCYDPALETFRTECPGVIHREEIRYYAMSQFGLIVNMCSVAPAQKVVAAIADAARASPLCRL